MNVATSPLPSGGPRSGARSMWLHILPPLWVPIATKDQYDSTTPTFSGFPYGGDINLATSPLPSEGPIVGRNQYGHITLAFSRSP